MVIPDRSGYGGSPGIADLPPDYHHRAAAETRAVIEALELSRPVLWGHSDGAIIALLLGLANPGAFAGLIVEAAHLYRFKPGSRAFFEAIAAQPAALGARASHTMARDHGDRWPHIVTLHARAWLRFTTDARSPVDDFYGGRLGGLQVPVLAMHGLDDPRTEPGEIDALRAALGADRSRARGRSRRMFATFDGGGHSPHSDSATAEAVTAAVVDFVGHVFAGRAHGDNHALPAPRRSR